MGVCRSSCKLSSDETKVPDILTCNPTVEANDAVVLRNRSCHFVEKFAFVALIEYFLATVLMNEYQCGVSVLITDTDNLCDGLTFYLDLPDTVRISILMTTIEEWRLRSITEHKLDGAETVAGRALCFD